MRAVAAADEYDDENDSHNGGRQHTEIYDPPPAAVLLDPRHPAHPTLSPEPTPR